MPHIRRAPAAALRIRMKSEQLSDTDTARLRIRDAAARRRRSRRDKRGNHPRSRQDRGNHPHSHWDNKGDGKDRGTGAPSNPNAAQPQGRAALRTVYNRTGCSMGYSTGGSRMGNSFDIRYSPGMPYIEDIEDIEDKDRDRRFVRLR